MEKNSPDWSLLLEDALTIPGKLSQAYRVFHRYSLGNQILATLQLSWRDLPISPIASFGKWKELGRSVKKGAKALELVMPVTIKGKLKTDKTAVEPESEKSGTGYTVFLLKKNWFSLEQTEGADFVQEPVSMNWDKKQALASLSISEVSFEEVDGNCQGYAIPNRKTVAINPLAAMPWKTLFHEIGHCILHSDEGQLADGQSMTTCIKEAEAEAVAYLCCATLELPGMEESRGYIQSWLSGQKLPEKSAQRIFSAADKILKAGSPAAE